MYFEQWICQLYQKLWPIALISQRRVHLQPSVQVDVYIYTLCIVVGSHSPETVLEENQVDVQLGYYFLEKIILNATLSEVVRFFCMIYMRAFY